MKVLISVDPGSVRIGYAVFCFQNECFLKKSGVFFVPKSSIGEKLVSVFNFFSVLVRELQSELGDVSFYFVVEKVFLGKGVQSCFLLSAFYYHIFFIASFYGFPCSDFLAVEVKKYLVGYGKATKSEVAESVIQMIPCVSQDLYSDEYDAIALGYVFLMRPSFS